MYLTDKEIKSIRTSQLKGELRSCLELASKILEEIRLREEN